MATVTQAQVAKAVGLSRSAVEKVLNPRTTHKFPEETRQKVFEAVNRLGYRPHRSAQLLRTGKSGIIGIIYSAGLYRATLNVEKKSFHEPPCDGLDNLKILDGLPFTYVAQLQNLSRVQSSPSMEEL